jgi:hypothetical protein
LQVISTHRALQHRARAVVALVVLSLAAFGLAACGGSGSSGSSDARSLLDQTFSGTHKIKSGKANLQFRLDVQGDPSLSQPIKLGVTGPFQSAGKNQIPKFDLALAINGQGQSIQAGLTSTSDRVFVKYGGNAYEVPSSMLDQIRQSMQHSQQQSSKGKLTLGGIGIDPQRWLKDPKVAGKETVGGVETEHITASLDVSAMLADVDKLLAKVKQQGGVPGTSAAQIPSSLPAKTKKQIEDAVKSSSVDVWTGASDKTLRKIAVVLAIQPKNPGSGPKSANISFSLELQDLNQPQTITAPGNVHPLSELLGQFGGLLGGSGLGGSSSSSGSSAGGASQQQLNAYTKCLQAAGSDVAKAQKCAALLTK